MGVSGTNQGAPKNLDLKLEQHANKVRNLTQFSMVKLACLLFVHLVGGSFQQNEDTPLKNQMTRIVIQKFLKNKAK